MNLKEAIIGYINKFKVIDQIVLIDALEISYPTASNSEKLQTLSELVQDRTIKRYDYTIEARQDRLQLYMPGDSRIMI